MSELHTARASGHLQSPLDEAICMAFVLSARPDSSDGCRESMFAPTPLLLAEVPVHVVAGRLGHSDSSITPRVCAHVVKEAESQAAGVFGTCQAG